MGKQMPSGFNDAISEATPMYFMHRFTVRIDGTIFDNLLGETCITFIDQNTQMPMVEIPEYMGDFFNGVSVVPLKFIMAIAFKGIHLPFRLMDRVKVICIDGNESNVHPSNLLWKFPVGGIEVPGWPGFFYIPGFTKQAIDEKDRILFIETGEIKTAGEVDVGYSKIYLERDYGRVALTGLHRIKGLTFLDYRPTVRKDVINHKDTNRRNNATSNLEWISVSENSKHAIQMYGSSFLNPKAVQVKDNRTGEIVTFNSMSDCAEHFETTASNVYRAVEGNSRGSTFQQHYFIKRPDQEWPVVNKEHTNIYSGGRAVLVKNLKTGAISNYKSATDFIRESGLSKKSVTVALKRNNQRELKGLIFKYADLPTEWRI